MNELTTPLEILYQDEWIVAVNKPAGILVHPGQGGCYNEPTVLHTLKKQIDKYIYPLHRLDRPVSGVLIFGLTKEFSSKMMQNWHASSNVKKYYALVKGKYTEAGEFNFKLKGQESRTEFNPIKVFDNRFTLMDILLHTGRKHQIRRHFSRRCSNLVGDTKYGNGEINQEFRDRFQFDRIFLHSYSFKFFHPDLKKEVIIQSPLPLSLKNILTQLKSDLP